MITAASAAALLLAAGQTAPPQGATQTPPPGSDITRSLNSGPPRPADYLAPAPAPAPEPATPEPAIPPAATQPAAPAERPTAPPPSERFSIPEPFEAPPEAQRPRVVPIPVEPSPPPRTAPITPPGNTLAPTPSRPNGDGFTMPEPFEAPAATTTSPPARPELAPPRPTPAPVTPAAAPAGPPPPPTVPAVTVLDAAARAALPFRVELPAGFELVTGRPGPDFRIYTIRRGDRSFAMVYAGPASQFPIYSGEVLETGGRASVVSTEDGVRHAREHLFQRPEGSSPREIHVWTMSLEGADRALAERIAQSVDVR